MRSLAKSRGSANDVLVIEVPGDTWASLTRSRLPVQIGPPKSVQHVWSMPIIPASGADTTTAVAGGYAAQWRAIGKQLQTGGNGATIVSLDMTAASKLAPAEQIRAWTAAADALRSTAPEIKLEWEIPADARTVEEVESTFPGAAKVDVVGITLVRSVDVQWPEQVKELNEWSDWAAANGKRVALRWSLGRESGAGSEAWVQNVRDWVARTSSAERLSFEAYGQLRSVRADSEGATAYARRF